jgi:plasmid maintenance system antidote protein VapI
VTLKKQKNTGGIMANRHKDFNELVAQEFEDLGFSQAYITNLINNEGLSLEEALRESIKSMGLQAFAEKAEISISYVSDFVNKRRNWSTDNLVKYIEQVFGLKIKMSVETPKGEVA